MTIRAKKPRKPRTAKKIGTIRAKAKSSASGHPAGWVNPQPVSHVPAGWEQPLRPPGQRL